MTKMDVHVYVESDLYKQVMLRKAEQTGRKVNFSDEVNAGLRLLLAEMPTCPHEWVMSDEIIMTNPPIYKYICRKCGMMKEWRELVFASPDQATYDDLVRQFHQREGPETDANPEE
jgi:hypothetical protein